MDLRKYFRIFISILASIMLSIALQGHWWYNVVDFRIIFINSISLLYKFQFSLNFYILLRWPGRFFSINFFLKCLLTQLLDEILCWKFGIFSKLLFHFRASQYKMDKNSSMCQFLEKYKNLMKIWFKLRNLKNDTCLKYKWKNAQS